MHAIPHISPWAVGALVVWLLMIGGWCLWRALRSAPDEEAPYSSDHPAYVRRGEAWFKAPELRPAPARFIGWQGGPGMEAFELYILTETIPGHPAESSVSRQTLERAGYFVPPPPFQFGAAAEQRRFLATGDDQAATAP